MVARSIDVDLAVPAEISPMAREKARGRAREAAVLALLEDGEITIGRAAEELDLSYHEMLDLMASRGIPVVRGPLDLDALEQARRKLAGGRP
jgi:predicted HTH domain antitoxin